MFPRLRMLVLSLSSVYAYPQVVITTIAGTDFIFPRQPLSAVNAPTGLLGCVATDHDGNLYACDRDNSLIFKVNHLGVLSIVAGNGSKAYAGDGGPATDAAFIGDLYGGIAIDAVGNLFVAETEIGLVRKVTPGRLITTVAYVNGTGPMAPQPGGVYIHNLAIDAVGNFYISQTNGIIKVTSSGVITKIVGITDRPGLSGDGGPATGECGSSGAAAKDAAPLVAVSVNSNGVARRDVMGLVKVRSAGVANTPQEVVVGLQVLPAGTST